MGFRQNSNPVFVSDRYKTSRVAVREADEVVQNIALHHITTVVLPPPLADDVPDVLHSEGVPVRLVLGLSNHFPFCELAVQRANRKHLLLGVVIDTHCFIACEGLVELLQTQQVGFLIQYIPHPDDGFGRDGSEEHASGIFPTVQRRNPDFIRVLHAQLERGHRRVRSGFVSTSLLEAEAVEHRGFRHRRDPVVSRRVLKEDDWRVGLVDFSRVALVVADPDDTGFTCDEELSTVSFGARRSGVPSRGNACGVRIGSVAALLLLLLLRLAGAGILGSGGTVARAEHDLRDGHRFA